MDWYQHFRLEPDLITKVKTGCCSCLTTGCNGLFLGHLGEALVLRITSVRMWIGTLGSPTEVFRIFSRQILEQVTKASFQIVSSSTLYYITGSVNDIRAQRGQDCYRILVLKEYLVHALILKAKLGATRAGQDRTLCCACWSSPCGRRWRLRVVSSARTSWKLIQSIDVIR